MSELDDDGFAKGDTALVPASPHVVVVPKFFDDCVTKDDAIRKMIAELGEPTSVELHGTDVQFGVIKNAMILILSILGDYVP